MKKSLKTTMCTVLSLGAVALITNWPTEGAQSIGPVQTMWTTNAPSTTDQPNTTVATTTEAPTTTSTTPDLSGVDWVALARETYGKCGEWHDLAIQVGWPEEEWDFLQEVIFRESRCQVDAWNGADAGLTQINKIHQKWLSDMGWSHPQDMFDPAKNLTFALRLWETSGWRPWRFSGPVPD